MKAEDRTRLIGTIALVVLVVALMVVAWQFYSKATGKKKATQLFEEAGIPPEKLAQIQIGMTREQVRAIIGREPLGVEEEIKPNAESPYGSPERWDYLIHMVLFRDGRVVYAGSTRIRRGVTDQQGTGMPPGGPPPDNG